MKKTAFNTQVVKFNVKLNGYATSVTLRKDIVSLWILLTEDTNPDVNLLVQDFIHDVVLKLWKKFHGRGLSDFVTSCMIRSVLTSRDYSMYTKILKKL